MPAAKASFVSVFNFWPDTRREINKYIANERNVSKGAKSKVKRNFRDAVSRRYSGLSNTRCHFNCTGVKLTFEITPIEILRQVNMKIVKYLVLCVELGLLSSWCNSVMARIKNVGVQMNQLNSNIYETEMGWTSAKPRVFEDQIMHSLMNGIKAPFSCKNPIIETNPKKLPEK